MVVHGGADVMDVVSILSATIIPLGVMADRKNKKTPEDDPAF